MKFIIYITITEVKYLQRTEANVKVLAEPTTTKFMTDLHGIQFYLSINIFAGSFEFFCCFQMSPFHEYTIRSGSVLLASYALFQYGIQINFVQFLSYMINCCRVGK